MLTQQSTTNSAEEASASRPGRVAPKSLGTHKSHLRKLHEIENRIKFDLTGSTLMKMEHFRMLSTTHKDTASWKHPMRKTTGQSMGFLRKVDSSLENPKFRTKLRIKENRINFNSSDESSHGGYGGST